MKINEILSESRSFASQDSITLPKIINQYKDVLKQYIDHDQIIYRGTRKDSLDLFVSDGSTMQRRAANTTNITNTLTSVLPSWKNWPSRPTSFICSLDRSYASDYGKTYIVVPLENQPIAVSSRMDFWQSLPVGLGGTSVSDFNVILEILFGIIDKNNDIEDIEDDADLIISTTDALLTNDANELVKSHLTKIGSYYKFSCLDLMEKLKEAGSAMNFYNSVLNPAVNNNLYPNFNNIPKGKGEVWMSGKVLFISEYIWSDILNELED